MRRIVWRSRFFGRWPFLGNDEWIRRTIVLPWPVARFTGEFGSVGDDDSLNAVWELDQHTPEWTYTKAAKAETK